MATRRNGPAGPTDPTNGDESGTAAAFVDEEAPEQTASDRVLHMLADVADDDRAKMTVHQVQPNGKEAWCEDLAPHDYELGGMKMIRDKWGPGTFKVRLYGMRGGNFGILTSAVVVVKESREPIALAAAPNNDALLLIAEGQQQLLRALAERPAVPVADPMAEMGRMFGMMKLMREAMGTDAAPAAPRSSVAELVDALKELRGAADLIAPNGGGGDDGESLLGMAKAFLPAIAQMAGNRRANGSDVVSAPAHHQLPAPGKVAPAATPAASAAAGPVTTWPALDEAAEIPTTGTDDVGTITSEALTTFKLKAYLQALVMMARNRMSTDKGAELVYEKLPDEWIDMLDLPTWWELFVQACPDATEHRAWFTEVRDKALQMFTEDATDGAGATQASSSGVPALP